MKTYIITIIFITGVLLSSCNNWLDLQPEGQAVEKEVFATGYGYRTVMGGLYKRMASASLYGRELSFGIIDCISQQYALNPTKIVDQKYIDATNFEYLSKNLNPAIVDIWGNSFNVIANANNLIQNIQIASPDLFEEGETERRLIMGEAYACRAMMHFDLLRLFAPAPVNDDGQSYVPYVEKYPDIYAARIDVKSFMEKVITDLELARDLVMDFDTTSLGRSVIATADSRFYDKQEYGMPGTTVVINSLYKGRGYRLNYYSITALLARVYQYAGKYTEALEYAKQLDAFEEEWMYTTYKFFSDNFNGLRSGTEETRTDFRVRSNLIFALYNDKAYDDYNLNDFFRIKSGAVLTPNYLIINNEAQRIFFTKLGTDESLLDFRYRYQTFKADNVYLLSGKYYCSTDEAVRTKNLSTIPMIRLTEMSYIMAECYARQGNWSEAAGILNQIRSRRGCSEAVNISNWADFQDELIRDARREWISEGQLFYLYKRLNADVNFGKNVIRPFSRNEYLLPVPDSQTF